MDSTCGRPARLCTARPGRRPSESAMEVPGSLPICSAETASTITSALRCSGNGVLDAAGEAGDFDGAQLGRRRALPSLPSSWLAGRVSLAWTSCRCLAPGRPGWAYTPVAVIRIAEASAALSRLRLRIIVVASPNGSRFRSIFVVAAPLQVRAPATETFAALSLPRNIFLMVAPARRESVICAYVFIAARGCPVGPVETGPRGAREWPDSKGFGDFRGAVSRASAPA